MPRPSLRPRLLASLALSSLALAAAPAAHADAPAAHKQTAHYLRWRDAVADMMASPRAAVRLGNLFPADAGW